jgi:polar amino acid transport system substrate-binding protein
VGEACHFVDLLSFLAGSLPARVRSSGLPDRGSYREDNLVLLLDFENGAVGSISFVAAGDPALGKERVEAFGGGASVVLEDCRSLRLARGGRTRSERARLRRDKGHVGEWRAIGRALRSGSAMPIPLESLVATSLATFAALRALRSGEGETVDARGWLAEARGSSGGETPESEAGPAASVSGKGLRPPGIG